MPDSHLEGSVADLDDDERYLVHSRLEITAVLRDYGVPLLDEQGAPVKP